jgi:hypothetical protein
VSRLPFLECAGFDGALDSSGADDTVSTALKQDKRMVLLALLRRARGPTSQSAEGAQLRGPRRGSRGGVLTSPGHRPG